MYSSMGRWDDATRIRDMMSDKQVHKNPGYSWSEFKKEMEDSNRDGLACNVISGMRSLYHAK